MIKILKQKKGITLIALVVTIIVLLILAGISISMLTGENGILGRSAEARDKAERAQFYEAAVMVYNGLLTTKYLNGSTPTIEEVVTEMRKDGYQIAEDIISGTRVTGVSLSNNLIGIAKDGTETVTYAVQTATEDNTTIYLAVLNKNQYEMSLSDGRITIDEEVYTRNSGATEDTKTVTATTSDTAKATAQVNKETNEITISGLAQGEGITLKVTAGGRTFDVGEITIKDLRQAAPANIYVGGTQATTLILDGSMLLSATKVGSGSTAFPRPSTLINEEYLWQSSNPEVVQVTQDGIIKCGIKTSAEADAEKAGSGTVTITCKGSGTTKATCTVTSTAKKLIGTITEESIAIPEGFTRINTNDAKWVGTTGAPEVNKGLVIMDEKGNQFVWVPVPNVVYESSKDVNLIKEYTTSLVSTAYTPMAIEVNGHYKGLLYEYDSSNGIKLYYPTAPNYQGKYREPTDLQSTSYPGDWVTGDNTKGLALIRKHITGMSEKTDQKIKEDWAKQLEDEYDAMVTSVNTNKGFWVGRYETSWDKKQEKTASIAGAKSWTAYSEEGTNSTGKTTWYGLYQKQKDFSQGKNYTSTMIWGSQYDAMMNWMAKNGLTVQTYDSTKRNADNYYITGSIVNTNDKWNNIQDLEGDVHEGTLEACETSLRVGRRWMEQHNGFSDASYAWISKYRYLDFG